MKTYEDLAQRWGLKPYCFSGVNDGWIPLLDALCAGLQATGYDLTQVAQIKQKMGGLRFSADGADEAQRALVNEAEDTSWTVCEFCGQPGKPVSHHGWIVTSCVECAKGF